MSQEELVDAIQTELNDDIETPTLKQRHRAVTRVANRKMAEGIGKPVYDYLDTTYWERIQQYLDEFIKPYDERIKKLEKK